MEEIKSWMNNGRPYPQGVQLLVTYSTDNRLKRLFTTEAESDFKRKKLEEVLRAILQQGITTTAKHQEQKEAAVQSVATAHNKWEGKETNEVLAALHNQWLPLFSEMKSLQHRIYDVAKAGTNDAAKKHEAGVMAHRILDLDDQCDAIYKKREHYLAHNTLPGDDKPAKAVVDPVKLPVALQNAKRYVREFKLKLTAAPGNEKAAAKLKYWEGMVEHYKKVLKLDNE